MSRSFPLFSTALQRAPLLRADASTLRWSLRGHSSQKRRQRARQFAAEMAEAGGRKEPSSEEGDQRRSILSPMQEDVIPLLSPLQEDVLPLPDSQVSEKLNYFKNLNF